MTRDEFLHLVRDELDLPVADDETGTDFDQIVSWNSLHMLRLVAAVERETGHSVPVGRLLADRNLDSIYARITAA
ncbi:phosphopantetheine-binding protein [Streptomyces sp. DSM 42041]|uniref:Phosphopantetheine-binding protein n=1 Tax=Streptomyces hazeniae TaxID=3075538 RepID=A0ABU2NS42_9ACTN|nr:phosphopantetheine-binding protein [Streptomyces sp. DSM 42041]MDT0378453.1 phosphopantetheine-binding protein [Streptomyces sp. DSM 42041]